MSDIKMESEVIRDHQRAGRKADSAECVRECLVIVRSMMSLGWDDDRMCVEFGVTPAKLNQYKSVIMAREHATLAHRPPEELFIEYRIMVMADADALLDIGAKAAKDKQFAAAANAHKGRAAIIDKLMDRGQELGVIPRAVKRHEVIGGIMVASLTDVELLAHIRREASETDALVARYGGGAKKFAAIPAPDDLYRPDPVETDKDEAPAPPVRRSKANK